METRSPETVRLREALSCKVRKAINKILQDKQGGPARVLPPRIALPGEHVIQVTFGWRRTEKKLIRDCCNCLHHGKTREISPCNKCLAKSSARKDRVAKANNWQSSNSCQPDNALKNRTYWGLIIVYRRS